MESDVANEVVSYRPIGVVRSPFSAVEGMPLQSVAAPEVVAQVEVVRLLAVTGSVLEIRGVDLLDGTPVLDIKPYVPAFDAVAAERTGWLTSAAERVHEVKADRRFDASG